MQLDRKGRRSWGMWAGKGDVDVGGTRSELDDARAVPGGSLVDLLDEVLLSNEGCLLGSEP